MTIPADATTQRLAHLEATVEAMAAEIRRLRANVAHPEARVAGSGKAEASEPDRRPDRRALLKLAVAGLGGVGLAAATGAAPAAAANGQPLVVGNATEATVDTGLTFDGPNPVTRGVLYVTDDTAFDPNFSGYGAIQGFSNNARAGGTGVVGYGTKSGVYGWNPSGGVGVFGQGTKGLYGVGLVDGVTGETSNANGSGVVGHQKSNGGIGVSGLGGDTGVYGTSSSVGVWGDGGAIGVKGFSTQTGVFGLTVGTFADSAAVVAENNATTNLGTGLRASHAGSGDAILASSAQGIAVHAQSTTTGVYAESPQTAVWGTAAHGTGVLGVTFDGTGVTGNAGPGVAVAGLAIAGTGVLGRGNTVGVQGESPNIAVHALTMASSATATAVLAEFRNTASTGYGVRASHAGSGDAVYATSVHGVALHGNGGTGRGGVFSGAAAQVKLTPGAGSTHPTAGSRGDLYVDKSGRLWFCKTGGSTATWKQIA